MARDKILEHKRISTLAKKLNDKNFCDPFQVEFDSKSVMSNIKEREFAYKRKVIQTPTCYFKDSKAFNGITMVNQLRDQTNYSKRKLIFHDNKQIAICGTSGVPILYEENGKNKILCNPNHSSYEAMLGEKLADKFRETPNRKITDLKGKWLTVHLQNNVISHFIFEVLKRVLFVARLTDFKLLFTGVKPALHILEFFTTDSALKDRIEDIEIADPNHMYRPEKVILPFEDHREISSEDAYNFQWFGESITERHRSKKIMRKKFISLEETVLLVGQLSTRMM